MSQVRNAVRAALHQLIGDKYEVLEWIGGGGMAEVYLAKHRAHGALFAVKVLADSLSNEPRIVARFHEEANTAAALAGHANIVPIFDIAEGAGLHYLIMPYVDGEDLSRYIEQHGRLSNAETVYVARQIADALVWASDKGVVHRDLKPSNVRLDKSGRVVVLDFGISKAMDVPTGLTTRGETLGTPYYMSPEQIRAEPCDARSDLYSLGVIIFELLSGRKPFVGDNLRIIEMGHLEKLPPALSTIVPEVDPVLEQLVNRLLEKEKDRRPSSPREVVEILRGLGVGQPPRAVEGKGRLGSPATPVLRPGPDPSPVPLPRPPRVDPMPPPAPPRPQPGPGMPGWLLPSLLGLIVFAGAGYWFSTREPSSKADTSKGGSSLNEPSYPSTVNDANGPLFLVPGGKFIFGDASPEAPNPRAEVELPSFYVDATEVSNEQYARFAAATGRAENPEFAKSPRLPVTNVTLDDAKAYCSWAGRRVPTEREWEKAARGADGRTYPWGNEPRSSPGSLVEVDELPERQSPYRALNMAGNVFEWTVSPFPVTDREIDDMAKLTAGKPVSREWANIKGGSFVLKDERFFRLYMRRGWPVNQASPLIGIRCVKDAKL